MRRLWHLLLVTMVLLSACKEDHPKPLSRLLVVHSYSDFAYGHGDNVRNVYAATPELNHMHAQVKHIFLGYPYNRKEDAVEVLQQGLDKLDANKWKPEVIIIHNDAAIAAYEEVYQMRPELQKIPVVFAGAMLKHTDLLTNCPGIMATGFRDSLYVRENLKLFHRLHGKTSDMMVELDDTPIDKLAREMLIEAIADTSMYINNLDFHINPADWNRHVYQEDSRQKSIVYAISVGAPMSNSSIRTANASQEKREAEGALIYRRILRSGKYIKQLRMTYDMYSNTIIDISRQPALSMVNAQFGNELRIVNLGGYFPLLQTQVDDAVRYAQRIVAGEPAKSLPIMLHKADYYLDWQAMKVAKLQFSSLDGMAQVINAPLSERNPQMYDLLMVGTCILGIALVLLVFVIAVKWIVRQQRRVAQQREQRMEWMLGGANSGIWHYRRGFFYISPTLSRILHIKEQCIQRENFIKMIHPEDRDEYFRAEKSSLVEGRHKVRYRLKPMGGSNFIWVEACHVVNVKHTVRLGIDGMMRVIDDELEEEKRLREQIQVAEETKLKEAFLANMTHDIRSPLSSIVSFADMLRDAGSMMDTEVKSTLMEQINESTHMLLKLLEDVVDMSKMQLGQYRFMMKPVSVDALVMSTYKANSVQVPHHLEYRIEMGEPLVIMVDADRLRQVLNNFLSNAFKNTPAGTITLGWKVSGPQHFKSRDVAERWVEIYVEDTGVGITKDRLDTIFDKFTKYDGKSGAGLGPNICKTIVEKQDGTIGVESVEGKGSRFWARFPEANLGGGRP